MGNAVVYSGPLGSDLLQRDAQLGVSKHKNAITGRVDSQRDRTELLFFPMDPELSYSTLDTNPSLVASRNAWGAFPGTAAGFLHQGGKQSYGVGMALWLANGGATTGVRGLYERLHGECELELKWQSFLDGVLSGIKNTSGEAQGDECNLLFCPNYDTTFTQRAARSYLRQSNPTAFGSQGRGGFGLHIKGEAGFDSPFIDDLSFFGRALYDVRLVDGLPHFEVAGGPWAATWDCSPSPGTICPSEDVESSIKGELLEAADRLNDSIGECTVAPVEFACGEPGDCLDNAIVDVLGNAARNEAIARGIPDARAQQLRDSLRTVDNWTCAPVSSSCAALTGAEATDEAVCQLKLRATKLVPMPDSFSLVWYEDDSSSVPVTAAAALYLALQNTQQTDQLAQLCSPAQEKRLRSFVRRTK